MGILEEHRQMRKIAYNRTRLSNVAANTIENGHKSSVLSNFFGRKKSVEKKGLLRKNRKLRLSLQFEQDENVELQSVEVQDQQALRQNEPDWTQVPEFNDLVYVGQRKRVELVRWCSMLSTKGRAERIDIVAR